jgi:hypothetical protein
VDPSRKGGILPSGFKILNPYPTDLPNLLESPHVNGGEDLRVKEIVKPANDIHSK